MLSLNLPYSHAYNTVFLSDCGITKFGAHYAQEHQISDFFVHYVDVAKTQIIAKMIDNELQSAYIFKTMRENVKVG